ncbi:MAG: ribose-phosphate pyrophosphokinase [Flavobacteriaceae bacterium]|nr:ribose-phosphate pyrophosphokinase [Flavobacteriaceae bacterium]
MEGRHAHEVKIFSGTGSQHLAEQITRYHGSGLGDLSFLKFSDGEYQPSINETVRGCDVFFIQSTYPPIDNMMELLMMIDAAKRASAHYITAVIPYFGYARQDRKDKPRVSIGSKLMADLLTAAGASRMMTMDLHAGQIQGFFNIPVDHLDASVIFIPYIQELGLENLTIAAPDMGGTTRARYFARILGADLVICNKERRQANEIAGMTVIGEVENANVVIVDDMIDTGGTLCKAAQMLREKGAKSVRAVCTHPVLSGKAYDNIDNSMLEELIVTDTIPLKQASLKIRQLTVAKLFSDAIRSVYSHSSISSLFDIQRQQTLNL